MITIDSSSLNSWGTVADFGCFSVIVGIIGESAELLVKWGRKRKFRDGFAVRFDEINRRRLVRFLKIVRPKILPVETIFVLMVIFGLAIEFWGTHKVNGILVKNNSELLATNGIISLQVAGLNKEAADARKKAADIEKQIAETSTNVDNLSPLKDPVTRVAAFVKLTAWFLHDPDPSGRFGTIIAKPNNEGIVGELTFFNSKDNKALSLFLNSPSLNIMQQDNIEWCDVLMQFQFQYANTHKRNFSGRQEILISTEMLGVPTSIITNFDSASLKLFVYPIRTNGIITLGGSATLVLNATPKEFPLHLQDPAPIPLIFK